MDVRLVVIRISQAGGGQRDNSTLWGVRSEVMLRQFKHSGYYASHCVCTRINVYVAIYNHKQSYDSCMDTTQTVRSLTHRCSHACSKTQCVVQMRSAIIMQADFNAHRCYWGSEKTVPHHVLIMHGDSLLAQQQLFSFFPDRDRWCQSFDWKRSQQCNPAHVQPIRAVSISNVYIHIQSEVQYASKVSTCTVITHSIVCNDALRVGSLINMQYD